MLREHRSSLKKTTLELNILQEATKKLSGDLQRRFQGLVQQDNLTQNKMASNELRAQRERWERNRPKKWLVCAVGIFLGALVSVVFPNLWSFLDSAMYDRSQLEALMYELIGDRYIKDALTSELMIVAYDYNSQQPRYYSKFFSEEQPKVYDVLFSNATGGSSAAPFYFEPMRILDKYGMENLLLDGGLIGNNPSMFAYLMESKLKTTLDKPIRILSMGTGGTTFKPVTGAGMSKLKWKKLSLEFMVNADIRAVDKTLRRKFALQLAKQKYPEKSNYLRIQTKSELKMNAVDEENIKGLLLAGEKMWQDQKEDAQKMLRELCDERFGPEIPNDGPYTCSAERPDCFKNGIDCKIGRAHV